MADKSNPYDNKPGITGLWVDDPRMSTEDQWASGYHQAQAAWTGMRPEDYLPGPADEPGDGDG